jgi:carbon storage regulator
MLLITRREGEAIVLNGTIEVRVLEIRGGRVKLGFEYPPGNTVFRQELFEKIQAENMAAATMSLAPDNDSQAARLQAAVAKLSTPTPQVGTGPAREGSNKKDPHNDLSTNTHD